MAGRAGREGYTQKRRLHQAASRRPPPTELCPVSGVFPAAGISSAVWDPAHIDLGFHDRIPWPREERHPGCSGVHWMSGLELAGRSGAGGCCRGGGRGPRAATSFVSIISRPAPDAVSAKWLNLQPSRADCGQGRWVLITEIRSHNWVFFDHAVSAYSEPRKRPAAGPKPLQQRRLPSAKLRKPAAPCGILLNRPNKGLDQI